VSSWEDVEAAEGRLEERGAERDLKRRRRDRRRAVLPFVLCPLILPAAGAAALLWLLEAEGGDLSSLTSAQAIGAFAAGFALPAALSAFVARHGGWLEAIAWTAITVCAELAMLAGLGLLALDLGPR
jgi:hypothetical protein